MTTAQPLMAGKRGLILGIANDRSLAWGIAKAVASQGAELAVTYQGDALLKRVRPLAEQLGTDIVLPADVTDGASLDALFGELAERWGRLDFLVHAVAFSDKEELKGRYIATSLDNFQRTMLVSVLLLHGPRPSRRAPDDRGRQPAHADLLRRRARHAALQRHGRRQGRARGLGPLPRGRPRRQGHPRQRHLGRPGATLAASGIGDFRYILKWNEYNAPLKRNTTLDDVGGAATYLLSGLGAGTTGEVLHVDSGYHVVGMKAVDAPDISVVKD